MKIVITGTKREVSTDHILGQILIDYFSKDHELICLGRRTGYDFYKNYDDIVEVARSADLFVNSSCIYNFQERLVDDVFGYVPHMLVIGSVSGDFHDALNSEDGYTKIKRDLKRKCKLITLEYPSSKTNLLHLTFTEIENKLENKTGFNEDNLKSIIEFWFKNPYISNIDFKFYDSEDFSEATKQEKVKQVINYYKNADS